MRSATKEERESVDCYIKSISHKTGLMSVANGVDYKVDFKLDDLDFYVKHPKSDMSNVYKIRINGKVYLAADRVLEIIDTAQTYKMYPGQEDKYIDKRVMREAVLALKGGEQE